MIYILIFDLGGEIGFFQLLLVMLLVFIAGFLPISIGSLGVREGAIVVGLGWFGVSTPIAVSAALVSRALMYVVAASAGAWWAVNRRGN